MVAKLEGAARAKALAGLTGWTALKDRDAIHADGLSQRDIDLARAIDD
jgi:hypothetical protein